MKEIYLSVEWNKNLCGWTVRSDDYRKTFIYKTKTQSILIAKREIRNQLGIKRASWILVNVN